jgi:phosphatidylserine/phosphatidylglycerophosphate/cardiolipin synthase-like enzyme
MKWNPTRFASPRYHFAWRERNRFELLVDGRAFYPRMLAAINSAKENVWLELYLFESGNVANQFIDALVRASLRGVGVWLLLDDYGALGLKTSDRRRLTESGVNLCFHNRLRPAKFLMNLARDHRKLLVVDGTTAFVGGAGITDEFQNTQHPERSWHEAMLAIQGPVVEDWQRLFTDAWGQHSARTLPAVRPVGGFHDGAPGRVLVGQAPRRREILRALITRLRHAERHAYLMTAYFVPSWRFKRALKRAAQRGVDVRLLLPGPVTDHPGVRHAGRRFYSTLLRHGVRIFEYRPRFLHAKIALVDDWVSMGSSNFDRWNLRWNLEANQEAQSQALAVQVTQLFKTDFVESMEIVPERWGRRPLLAKVRERFWGRVDLWLHRLGRGRGEHD